MGYFLTQLPLFFVAVIFGIAMLGESYSILKLHKQITPLPSMILYWIGVGLVGKEKSARTFAGKNTLKNLRTYAFITLGFGVALLVSSFISLNSFLAQ